MDKRDDRVWVRIPHELKRRVRKHASRHLRSLSRDLLYLIERGLHDDEFIPDACPEDTADDD